MSWESSDRRLRLPSDWQERRQFVAARASYRCEAMLNDGTRCPAMGTDCDHVVRGDNHDVSNLQWLCQWHHKRKTNNEAAAARLSKKKSEYKPPHPGLI